MKFINFFYICIVKTQNNTLLIKTMDKMKKATTLIVGLILGISSALFANGSEEKDQMELNVKIIPGSTGDVFKLMYLSDNKEWVQVNIYNTSGKKILSDKIRNKRGFLRPYNFKSLPEGMYTIEVMTENTVKKEVVKLVEDEPQMNISFDPVAENKRVKLTVTGPEVQPLLVNIYNQRSELVTQDYIDTEKSFSKVYNFNKIAEQKYIFEIISNGKVIAKKSW